MKQKKLIGMLAAFLTINGATVLTSCKEAHAQEDNPVQQDFNKTEQQYQQGRKHKPADEGDVTPVEPETAPEA